MLDRRVPRRSFLTAIAAATGASVVAPLFARDALEARAQSSDPWDLSWLDRLHGKHKQFFDVGKKIDQAPGPLHIVTNYLDTFHDVYGLDFSQVNTVVGIAGAGFPINAGDALWMKYKLASRWQITDSVGRDARHNPFLDPPADESTPRSSVKGLQARGTIFTQCDKALHAIATELAAAFHQPGDAVYAELAAGLHPGVRLVPANTMICGLAQEHGFAYESV